MIYTDFEGEEGQRNRGAKKNWPQRAQRAQRIEKSKIKVQNAKLRDRYAMTFILF